LLLLLLHYSTAEQDKSSKRKGALKKEKQNKSDEDDLVEECKSEYAPQNTDKCECDDSLECIEDSSSAFVIHLARISLTLFP